MGQGGWELPETLLGLHPPSDPHSRAPVGGKRGPTTNRFEPGDLGGQAVGHSLVLPVQNLLHSARALSYEKKDAGGVHPSTSTAFQLCLSGICGLRVLSPSGPVRHLGAWTHLSPDTPDRLHERQCMRTRPRQDRQAPSNTHTPKGFDLV